MSQCDFGTRVLSLMTAVLAVKKKIDMHIFFGSYGRDKEQGDMAWHKGGLDLGLPMTS